MIDVSVQNNIPPGPFPADYLADPLAIYDVYAASAIAGITSADFDCKLPIQSIGSRASEVAMDSMRMRHLNREKIILAMQSVTPNTNGEQP